MTAHIASGCRLCGCVPGLCGTISPSASTQVPQGHVWLQGDNTLNSTDSRHYGPVPYSLLNGKAIAKVSMSTIKQPHRAVRSIQACMDDR